MITFRSLNTNVTAYSCSKISSCYDLAKNLNVLAVSCCFANNCNKPVSITSLKQSTTTTTTTKTSSTTTMQSSINNSIKLVFSYLLTGFVVFLNIYFFMN